MDQWLLGIGLEEGEGLLAIPVLTGGRDCEAGFWVDEWLGRLGEGKRLLSVPVLAGGGDGKTSLGVNK